VAVVVDFIGQDEYRRSLEAIGHALNSKGFVTPFDDVFFALELELLNLERLRAHCSGNFQLLPGSCHAGMDLLIGLGQTIPTLSAKGKTRLLGRIKKGLEEGLWPLQHEMRIAANLSRRGWDIYFHDFEEGGGYDFLITKDGVTYEVEAKAMSAFTGWPIKPENLNKLLVEVKQHFAWKECGIPVIGATLSSSLSPDRTELQRLVSAFNMVAQTREGLSLSDAEVRFIGVVPDLTLDKLMKASYRHSQLAKRIVLVNPTHPKLVLELHSNRPVLLRRKIVQTISETTRKQFSRSNPGVIWTHINFIPDDVFLSLGAQQDGRTCLLDSIANATLVSEKRNHLSQLVFSGGSFLNRTDSTARSSYRAIAYDSPACRFGKNVIFEGGRKYPQNKVA